MSEKSPSRDEALEAMDFIVNILKEHEKDLDKLISELGAVTEQLGEAGELNDKVKNIEQKIDSLQNEMSTLFKRFQTQTKTPTTQTAPTPQHQNPPTQTTPTTIPTNIPLTLQCKQWQDFQTLAQQAQTISFTYNENQNTFQASALKNHQIITYNGELPKHAHLIKTWLSKQLQTPENKILEAELTLH